jgi:hypothetical protein
MLTAPGEIDITEGAGTTSTIVLTPAPRPAGGGGSVIVTVYVPGDVAAETPIRKDVVADVEEIVYGYVTGEGTVTAPGGRPVMFRVPVPERPVPNVRLTVMRGPSVVLGTVTKTGEAVRAPSARPGRRRAPINPEARRSFRDVVMSSTS